MGMDVYGKKPSAIEGEYFRNNVWWWRPLANYALVTAPAITAKCSHWHSNDGDGLGARDSVRLADALQTEIDTGRCATYAERYEARLQAVPDEQCKFCHGTGIRDDEVGRKYGSPEKIVPAPHDGEEPNPRAGQVGWCNGCGGRGSVRPFETQYPFSVKNVQQFIAFLRACGGFKIC